MKMYTIIKVQRVYFYYKNKSGFATLRVKLFAPKEVIYFIFSISPSMITGIPPSQWATQTALQK